VQWKEASYTDKQGDVFRVYTVCNVDATVVDNWLRLPFIRVPADPDGAGVGGGGGGDDDPVRLYVEMRFTMRRCTSYPEPGRLQRCRESFKLLAYDATSDVGNERRPTWDDRTYRTIGVVAADRVFADAADASVMNDEVRGLQVRRGAGVYLALRDEGTCATLLRVRVYYVVCETTTAHLAVFPLTVAGPEVTSVVQVCEPSFTFLQLHCHCLMIGKENQPRTSLTAIFPHFPSVECTRPVLFKTCLS